MRKIGFDFRPMVSWGKFLRIFCRMRFCYTIFREKNQPTLMYILYSYFFLYNPAKNISDLEAINMITASSTATLIAS